MRRSPRFIRYVILHSINGRERNYRITNQLQLSFSFSILKHLFASAAGAVGLTLSSKAVAATSPEPAAQKEVFNVVMQDDVPLFSGSTKLGNLVFVAGKGYHKEGDIKLHTDEVLKELEKELIKASQILKTEKYCIIKIKSMGTIILKIN